MEAAARRAPVLVMFMLDTIGLDCQHDAPDELDALWRFCLAEADGILFNSAFTARQFARRFGPAARVSPAVAPFAGARRTTGSRRCRRLAADGKILLVGNAMPHKRLRETARRLAAARLARPVSVLGLPPGVVASVEALPSGPVAPEAVAALYAEARVVVYPSVYEGFGFPILDALAHRRPVLVRDLRPMPRSLAGLPERANVHRLPRRRGADPAARRSSGLDRRAALPGRCGTGTTPPTTSGPCSTPRSRRPTATGSSAASTPCAAA